MLLIAPWFGSRLARPISALTTTARRVERGDLHASSSVTTPDEIGILASAIDRMTSSPRRTIAAEQDTRRSLQTIVAGMGEGLVAMDADFTIVSFNPAAEAITGVKASEAVGRTCHDVHGSLTARAGDARYATTSAHCGTVGDGTPRSRFARPRGGRSPPP